MSGRLVILPKKSYCPWSQKNLDRVERDERIHSAALEKERKQLDKDASITRLLTLKKRNHDSHAASVATQEDGNNSKLERFNLFDQEERQHLESLQQTELLSGSGKGNGGDKKNTIMIRDKKDLPFYLKPPEKMVGSSLGIKEKKRKRKMDPMHFFHRDDERERELPCRPKNTREVEENPASKDEEQLLENKRNEKCKSRRTHYDYGSSDSGDTSSSDDSSVTKHRRRRHKNKSNRNQRKDSEGKRKRKKQSKKRSKASVSTDDSIAELRRRRAEREERERRRQDDLIGSSNNRNRLEKYSDQYNPRFSRN